MSNKHSNIVNPVGFFRINADDPEYGYHDEKGRRPLVKIAMVGDHPIYFGNAIVDEKVAFTKAKLAADDFIRIHALTPVPPKVLDAILREEEP